MSPINALIIRVANSRLMSLVLLFSFFWIVASASHAGFAGKWGLQNGHDYLRRSNDSIELILNATAEKPFVYRQLAPIIARVADRVTPKRVKTYVNSTVRPDNTFSRLKFDQNTSIKFQSLVVFYLSFVALLASLFLLRKITLFHGASSLAAVLAPTALILTMPYLQTRSGYFYDSIELFFMGAVFVAAMKGDLAILVALVFPATLNKETFIFFLPALYPILRKNYNVKTTASCLSIAVVVAAGINILGKLWFADSYGEFASYQLLRNINDYLDFKTYFILEGTYGNVGPGRMFIGSLVVIALVVVRGWRDIRPEIKQHVQIVSIINIPLFFLFAGSGELRNLSFLFVGFVVLMAACLSKGNRVDYGG